MKSVTIANVPVFRDWLGGSPYYIFSIVNFPIILM